MAEPGSGQRFEGSGSPHLKQHRSSVDQLVWLRPHHPAGRSRRRRQSKRHEHQTSHGPEQGGPKAAGPKDAGRRDAGAERPTPNRRRELVHDISLASCEVRAIIIRANAHQSFHGGGGLRSMHCRNGCAGRRSGIKIIYESTVSRWTLWYSCDS